MYLILRLVILPLIAFVCCLFLPESSMALQTHGESEGIGIQGYSEEGRKPQTCQQESGNSQQNNEGEESAS
jgi:hypothetical protein